MNKGNFGGNADNVTNDTVSIKQAILVLVGLSLLFLTILLISSDVFKLGTPFLVTTSLKETPITETVSPSYTDADFAPMQKTPAVSELESTLAQVTQKDDVNLIIGILGILLLSFFIIGVVIVVYYHIKSLMVVTPLKVSKGGNNVLCKRGIGLDLPKD
jgi:hypothetical protein